MCVNCWTDTISGLAAKAAASITENPGDFVYDGLLHCGVCGMPKQVRIELGNMVFTPPALCPCEEARIKAQEEAAALRALKLRIDALRNAAFSQRLMQSWTFENDDGKRGDILNVMQNYVEHFDELKKKGKGLLLYGPVGTGKTYAACQVANALIDREISCLVTNFGALTNRLQSSYQGKQEFLDGLSDYTLLVIDDLGAERKTEYMQEIVFSVIDSRYRSGLPMIITTNLELSDLTKPDSTENARIYDRILERCHPVEISGQSRRRDVIRADYEGLQEVLFG